MYTQCSHCRAIFRVTMKELTAAQGLLRCGECDTIFDAMKAVTTTLPSDTPTTIIGDNNLGLEQYPHTTIDRLVNWLPWRRSRYQDAYARHASHLQRSHQAGKSHWLLGVSIAALSILMLLQIAYATRHWLVQQPVIGQVIEDACQNIDCKLQPKRDLQQIRWLSKNVFSHPNAPNVLVVKASVQNEADFTQPYPYVEISFLNAASEIVALRRFKPSEYLEQRQESMMPTHKPRELSVNIKDPGTEAVRYQFRFL